MCLFHLKKILQLFAYFFKRKVSQVQSDKRHLNEKQFLKEDLWPRQKKGPGAKRQKMKCKKMKCKKNPSLG